MGNYNRELLFIEKVARKYDECNIPLYLSYPTVGCWNHAPDPERLLSDFNAGEDIFYYFHIPYCRTSCLYCMCYHLVTSDESVKDRYVDALLREFRFKVRHLDATKKTISHLHLGGGTPTFLTEGQLGKLCNAVFAELQIDNSRDTSISLEAYPDDEVVTYSKLKLLKEAGFNEISFGVQDFDARIQKAINRNCPREVLGRLISMAGEIGFRVHIDLCYGLPFQGHNELEKTIEFLTRYSPDRIALYTYVHYPTQFPQQRYIPSSSLPNSFMTVLLFQTAHDLLISSGYERVGYDHFVKSGNALAAAMAENKVVRNFMGHTSFERREFVGFGNSALSFLGDSYYQNNLDMKIYLENTASDKLPLEPQCSYTMGTGDAIRNEIILKQILCDFRIDKVAINQMFDIDFDTMFKKELNELSAFYADRLIKEPDDPVIELSFLGSCFARHIARVFDGFNK